LTAETINDLTGVIPDFFCHPWKLVDSGQNRLLLTELFGDHTPYTVSAVNKSSSAPAGPVSTFQEYYTVSQKELSNSSVLWD